MGLIFPFFHSPKPRGFYHRPIYWDPEKERHDQIVADAKKRHGVTEDSNDKGAYHSSITRGSFRRARLESKEDVSTITQVRDERRRANRRFLIIVLLLLVVILILFL